jgi:hypothetical protein
LATFIEMLPDIPNLVLEKRAVEIILILKE